MVKTILLVTGFVAVSVSGVMARDCIDCHRDVTPGAINFFSTIININPLSPLSHEYQYKETSKNKLRTHFRIGFYPREDGLQLILKKE